MLRQLSICAFLAFAFVPLGTAGGEPGTLWDQYPLEQRTGVVPPTTARARPASPPRSTSRPVAAVTLPVAQKTRAKAEDSSPLPLTEGLEVVLPFGIVLLGAAVVARRRRREDEPSSAVERVHESDEAPAAQPLPEPAEEAEPAPIAAEELHATTPPAEDHWGWLDEVAPEATAPDPSPETPALPPDPVAEVKSDHAARPEEPEPAAEEQSHAEPAFLLFVESTGGYELLEGHGPPPQVGGAVELADGNGGARFVVTRIGPSPFPTDPRRCAYLERQIFTVD